MKAMTLDAGAARILVDAAAKADAIAAGTPEALRAYMGRAHVSSVEDVRRYWPALHAVGYLSEREDGASRITPAGRRALKRSR